MSKSQVNVKINGLSVQVEEGTTLLDAAKKLNLKIEVFKFV